MNFQSVGTFAILICGLQLIGLLFIILRLVTRKKVEFSIDLSKRLEESGTSSPFDDLPKEWWKDDEETIANVLRVPKSLLAEFEEFANSHKVTVEDLLRQYLKLGLVSDYLALRGGYLQSYEDGKVTRLIIFSDEDSDDDS